MFFPQPGSSLKILISRSFHYYTITGPVLIHRFSALLLLLFIVSSANSFAQTKKEITTRGIQSVTINIFDARKKDTTSRKIFSGFDQRGNVLETIEYDLKGNIKSWEQFEYNQQDSEIEYRELLPDGKILNSTYTTYDKWRNVIEKTTMDSQGSLIERTSYTYNNFNNLLAEQTADKEGKIIHRVTYQYDNKGMLLSRRIFNDKDQLIYSKEYTYQY